jgi:hypothetical protein
VGLTDIPRRREDPLPWPPYAVLLYQSTARTSPSGPFTIRIAAAQATNGTVIASNLPFGSGAVVIGPSQAHLVHVSTLSGPGIGPDIQPVIHGDR